AGDIGPAAIAILGVPIGVGAGRLRIGVLHLAGCYALPKKIRRRGRGHAVYIIESRVPCDQPDEIGASTAHDRLVVIITDSVEIAHLLKEGSVSGIHVEEAHRQAALICIVGQCRRGLMVAGARGLRDPYKQILSVVVADLLPHLEKGWTGSPGKSL